MSLIVAPCSREAATYAVMHWHYSQRMPTGRLIHFGVWERDAFIGAVIFGRGANDRMLRPFNLKQAHGCELVRVALTAHESPVSQIVALALKELKASNPGLRICVSYADPAQGHHGGIYQAGGWLYLGSSAEQTEWIINGRQTHARSVSALRETSAGGVNAIRDGELRIDWLRRCFDPRTQPVTVPAKHRYVMPLDKQMRRMLTKQAQPYPAPADMRPRDRRRSAHTPVGGAGSTPADRSEEVS